MQSVTDSQKYLKQRRFFMVLPALVLPFILVLFLALGGGKGSGERLQDINGQGLNLRLPEPHFKNGKEKDKMSLYEQSGRDSLKFQEAIKHDPYYTRDSLKQRPELKVGNNELQSIFDKASAHFNQSDFSKLNTAVDTNQQADPNEKKIMAKLTQLKAALKKNNDPSLTGYNTRGTGKPAPDIEKLAKLMNTMKQSGQAEPDPELDRINVMLDKVMYIQHPEKLQDSMRSLSLKNKGQVFPVEVSNVGKEVQTSGFYGLSDSIDVDNNIANTIQAMVEQNQILVSGAVVKLRLLQDIYVHGILIPRNQMVYGIAMLTSERLKISINSIRCNRNILPVSLEVFDMDGLAGIYVPGSINRDVSKQSADEAMSGIGLTSFDPSLGAQAANAGIQAAKTLMSKKIKMIRVNLKAGYQVLLKNAIP